MNQLSQKKTLLGMFVAALMCVALLAVAAPQEAYATQGWNSNSKGFWYEYNSKGSYYKNGWKQIDGEWYYFQKNGYAKEGWIKSGKYWYYLDGDASWMDDDDWDEWAQYDPYVAKINGSYRYAPTMVYESFLEINNKRYSFDKSGRMTVGWIKTIEFNGEYGHYVYWLYGTSSGALAQGWKKINGKWYCFGNYDDEDKKWSGYVSVNGWRTIKGVDYYFDKNTAMVTGWQKIDGKWYYFAKSGAMQKSKWIGNYYVQDDGTMATNTWIGKYHVNANGKWDKTK